MTLQRLPMPALRPFVALVWASEGCGSGDAGETVREHALPTGMMHLVLRLTDTPLRIADPRHHDGAQPMAAALVGGARSGFYVREFSGRACSVGAVLRPGAAQCLFGTSAHELAERHTPLEDLWGAGARSLRLRLQETPNAHDRLALLEVVLSARLPRLRGLHPAVASALAERPGTWSVGEAVRRSGVSHRRFIALFKETVGLPPKTWLRVQRFQQVMAAVGQGTGASLAEIALDACYSDQSHFNRDFLALSGVTPQAYRRISPDERNHLPVPARPRSIG
ncbi:helix-turn-helix domain-containing protein [Hydrogenophaga sp.]|uniref:AraC family transcriptional regulator n=1 Tax=Hydrogenophaga sp. TaxID=1904254 RepID=UPI003F703E82